MSVIACFRQPTNVVSRTSRLDPPFHFPQSIAEVAFSGALQIATSDQDQIAASIKQQTKGNSLDEVTNEALERARAGWQNQGYFKVKVSGETKILTSGPASQRIALSVHVDEGLQYRLREITFKHNHAIGANIWVANSGSGTVSKFSS